MIDEKYRIIFNALKPILKKYEKNLVLKADTEGKYFLYTPTLPNGKLVYKKDTLYFGGVEIRKNYVSYHLFAVYMFPELLKNISPELKKRMQGKSCFNFKKEDDKLFAELKGLTESCFKKYKSEKYL